MAKDVYTIRYNGGKRSECATDERKAIKIAQKWIQDPARGQYETIEVIGPGWVTLTHEGPKSADEPHGWQSQEWGRAVIFEAGIRTQEDELLETLLFEPQTIRWAELSPYHVAKLSQLFDERMAA